MRESIGMPVSMLLSVSRISPPKATVSPDCMATVLEILRCRMVGESIPELKTKRTELLILITPRVVGSLQDARDVTEELRRRLRAVIPLGRRIE